VVGFFGSRIHEYVMRYLTCESSNKHETKTEKHEKNNYVLCKFIVGSLVGTAMAIGCVLAMKFTTRNVKKAIHVFANVVDSALNQSSDEGATEHNDAVANVKDIQAANCLNKSPRSSKNIKNYKNRRDSISSMKRSSPNLEKQIQKQKRKQRSLSARTKKIQINKRFHCQTIIALMPNNKQCELYSEVRLEGESCIHYLLPFYDENAEQDKRWKIHTMVRTKCPKRGAPLYLFSLEDVENLTCASKRDKEAKRILIESFFSKETNNSLWTFSKRDPIYLSEAEFDNNQFPGKFSTYQLAVPCFRRLE